MMKRGANVNIGSIDTFPFQLNGGAFINATAPTLTFNNKVDLGNGGVLDSAANIKLIIRTH